jgi:FkbM family methyltransferase
MEHHETMSVNSIVRSACPPAIWSLGLRLKRRLRPAKERWEVLHGEKLWVPAMHNLPHIIRGFPYYDTELTSFCRYVGREWNAEFLVVDVGANIGDTARFVSAALPPEKLRLICIEADQRYIPFLKENTQDLNVKIVETIVGERDGEVSAKVASQVGGTSKIVADNTSSKMKSLDSILAGERPNIIKIVTDGYELRVLRGALTCLREVGPHLSLGFVPPSIRTYGHDEPLSLFPFLRELGYRSVVAYDNSGYPFGLFDVMSVAMIARYADVRKPWLYLKLLVSKEESLLDSFYQTEILRFPPAKVVGADAPVFTQ